MSRMSNTYDRGMSRLPRKSTPIRRIPSQRDGLELLALRLILSSPVSDPFCRVYADHGLHASVPGTADRVLNFILVELVLKGVGRDMYSGQLYLACNVVGYWCDPGMLKTRDMLQNIKYSEDSEVDSNHCIAVLKGSAWANWIADGQSSGHEVDDLYKIGDHCLSLRSNAIYTIQVICSIPDMSS